MVALLTLLNLSWCGNRDLNSFRAGPNTWLWESALSNSCSIFLEFSRCCAKQQRARMSTSCAVGGLIIYGGLLFVDWSVVAQRRGHFDIQVVHTKGRRQVLSCVLSGMWNGCSPQVVCFIVHLFRKNRKKFGRIASGGADDKAHMMWWW